LPSIGNERLADLAPELIQEVINYHYERGRQRTAAYIRTVLRAAFKRAVKLKRMASNPVDALDTVNVVVAETEVFTAEQGDAFIKAAENHRLEGLFWLALAMGLRKGELCGLSLPDLDLENASVQVRETIQRVKLPRGQQVAHPRRPAQIQSQPAQASITKFCSRRFAAAVDQT
jgi:integrase